MKSCAGTLTCMPKLKTPEFMEHGGRKTIGFRISLYRDSGQVFFSGTRGNRPQARAGIAFWRRELEISLFVIVMRGFS